MLLQAPTADSRLKCFNPSLGKVHTHLTKVHRSLCAILQGAMPVGVGAEASPLAFEATVDALEQLKAVLRDEHSLLTQYKMITWGRILTPIQVCAAGNPDALQAPHRGLSYGLVLALCCWCW